MPEVKEEATGAVTVHVDSSATMVAHVQVRGQEIRIDESEKGQLQGSINPYDYILSALGACTAITVQLYAQRKKWPLARVEVSLSHERVHAQDCERCDDKNARLSQIRKRIRFMGDLTPEQRQRLQEISARCPVQKSLEAGIWVKTVLVEEV